MTDFITRAPTLEDYWRGIVLLGRNVASYKFALAKTLLEVNPEGGQLISLEELSPVFAKHICHHLKNADKQNTASSSKFLTTCRQFNNDEIGSQQLADHTSKLGFVNVIDAFHIVNNGETPVRFFVDERKTGKGIRVTDEFNLLMNSVQAANLPREVEARWRLIEAAWALGVSKSLVSVEFDSEDELLYRFDRKLRRKAVTSSRDALNGYQRGKCFYCFDDINIDDPALLPDVDHFFAHKLKQRGFGQVVDGVWNLVLACKDCNRGVKGKFEKIPTKSLLLRLNTRNEHLISSHHPLRETLIQQTGRSLRERRSFLENFYENAWKILLHTWESELKGTPSF